MTMLSNLLGTAITLKTRLVDKAIGKLPEPLRSEASGLRAETAGHMKEFAAFGMELFSSMNERIVVDHEIAEDKKGKSDNSKLKKIELD